jgi:hypothetical protein
MTMKITTRQLHGNEMLDALYALNQYSLNPSPPAAKTCHQAAKQTSNGELKNGY